MKRDMELCRKILFAIEEQYQDSEIINLQIESYSMSQVAYHCMLLENGGFLDGYHAQYADDALYFFTVGPLTWEGHDFLDKIREETVWNKTKAIITNKGLPMALDVIKQIATAVITDMAKGAVEAFLEKGGVR